MLERDILSACEHAITDGKAWSETFHDDRRRALNFYLGLPFGDEKKGRDKTVLSDVADAVEWTIPTLLRIFTSGSNIVSFQPMNADDEDAADQESKYADHVFWNVNDGFGIMYDWFKDALIMKIGVVKVWWISEDHVELERYFDQTPLELKMLRADDDVDVTNIEPKRLIVNDPNTFDPIPEERFDIEVRRFTRRDRVKVEVVPTEEFRTSPNARDIDTAPYNIHTYDATRSRLIEMGFPEAEVMALQGVENRRRLDPHEHRTGRNPGVFRGSATSQVDTIIDPSMVEVTVNECYIWMDADGDGKAELMQVFVAQNQILGEPKEWAGTMPFVSISPIPMPHEVIGRSWADQVMPLQYARSQVLRQMIDNMERTNNVRWEVPDAITGESTFEDILTDSPGGIVRTEGMGGIRPLEAPVTWQHGTGVLQILGEEGSRRVGLNAFNMGMVPDTAESGRTAAGSMAFRKAANQRIDTVARIFGEGLRRLYLKIHENLRRYQDTETVLKINNKYADIDPSNWRSRTEAVCRVGMGAMDVDEQMAAMNGIFQMLIQFMQNPDPVMRNMAQPENIFSLAKEMMELSTVMAPDRFLTDPEQARQMAEQQSQQQAQQAEQQMQQQVQMQQQMLQLEAQMQVMQDQAKERAKSEAEMARIGQQTQSDLVEGDAEHSQDLDENAQLHQFRLIEQAQKAALEREQARVEDLIGEPA